MSQLLTGSRSVSRVVNTIQTTEEEIYQAIRDFNSGRFGEIDF